MLSSVVARDVHLGPCQLVNALLSLHALKLFLEVFFFLLGMVNMLALALIGGLGHFGVCFGIGRGLNPTVLGKLDL